MMVRRRRVGLPRFPRRRMSLERLAILLIVALLIVLLRRWNPPEPPPEWLAAGDYQVQRVIDGDTLELTNGARVRLIGVDTPETVKPRHPEEPWGREATEFTCLFVAAGRVRLELDREPKDKYGRFLAYVWVDDRMLNEELLRAGLARAETRYSFTPARKRQFLRAEAEARAAGRGIWSHKAATVGRAPDKAATVGRALGATATAARRARPTVAAFWVLVNRPGVG